MDLETQKEGKKSTLKGREAEVTSTVQERSREQMQDCFVLNASTSLASQEHAYQRRFLFS